MKNKDQLQAYFNHIFVGYFTQGHKARTPPGVMVQSKDTVNTSPLIEMLTLPESVHYHRLYELGYNRCIEGSSTPSPDTKVLLVEAETEPDSVDETSLLELCKACHKKRILLIIISSIGTCEIMASQIDNSLLVEFTEDCRLIAMDGTEIVPNIVWEPELTKVETAPPVVRPVLYLGGFIAYCFIILEVCVAFPLWHCSRTIPPQTPKTIHLNLWGDFNPVVSFSLRAKG